MSKDVQAKMTQASLLSGALAILRDQAVEIDKLRWLPERDPDRGEWADGWNRCLEYIMDKRAGIEPGDGEHE